MSVVIVVVVVVIMAGLGGWLWWTRPGTTSVAVPAGVGRQGVGKVDGRLSDL